MSQYDEIGCELEGRYPIIQEGYFSNTSAIPHEGMGKMRWPLLRNYLETCCVIGGISNWAAEDLVATSQIAISAHPFSEDVQTHQHDLKFSVLFFSRDWGIPSATCRSHTSPSPETLKLSKNQQDLSVGAKNLQESARAPLSVFFNVAMQSWVFREK